MKKIDTLTERKSEMEEHGSELMEEENNKITQLVRLENINFGQH